MKTHHTLMLTVLLAMSGMLWAQEAPLKGRITDDQTGNPIAGAKVTLGNQNISTTTNDKGEYQFYLIEPGDEEIVVEADGYVSDIMLVSLSKDANAEQSLKLKPDIAKQAKDDILLNLSEDDMSDDEGKGQEQNSATSSSMDEFNKITSFAWSTARYRNRGYSQNYENNYINGMNFMSAERGMFNFSAMGGLNDATRNKETVQAMEASNFTFGNIGNSTNYLMNAYRFAQGWKVGLAGTNRNYKAAVRATYASGVLKNGWAFVGQIAFRFSPYCPQKGIIGEGSDYYSLGAFFSAEKRWKGDKHSLGIVAFANMTSRGQNSALTQEVVDLTGTTYYNPYWGYQDGKMRNSRIVHSFDPTAIVTYEFKPNPAHDLKVGVAGHYSFYSNSAINFYNAPDPRPDYYRNLPSFLWDGQIAYSGSDQLYNKYGADADGLHYGWGNFIGADMNGKNLGEGFVGEDGNLIGPSVDEKVYNTLAKEWQERNTKTTQLDWDAMYAANKANNVNNPEGSAHYIQERRHNDIWEVGTNLHYTWSGHEHLKLSVGLEGKASQGLHYKTIDDLLGANQWIDIDPFADRDIAELASNLGLTQTEINVIKQNDLTKGYNKVKHQGDRFGYDYSMNVMSESLWFQNEWSFNEIDFYYGIKETYSSMRRNSSMINGREAYLCQLAFSQYGYTQMDKVLEECSKYLGRDADYFVDHFNNGVLQGVAPGTVWHGNQHSFLDPAAKIGFTYKINGRNHIKFNAMAQTMAPLARVSYISPRIHDRVVENIYTHDNAKNLKDYYAANEKSVGGDITYEFNYPIVRGRVTAYYTRFWNGTELNGYYDDDAQTFVNQVLTGLNRRHCGVEAAASVKLGTYFTLSGALAIGDYRYMSDALSVTSAENGMEMAKIESTNQSVFELRDSVYMKGVRVSTGPQLNTSIKLSFFHPKMWFADITVSYYDWNYLSVAPSRRMYGLYTGKRAGETAETKTIVNGGYYRTFQVTNGSSTETSAVTAERDKNGKPILAYPYSIYDSQESLSATNPLNRFMVDVSFGKLIYLKNRQSLSINLSVTNLLNNNKFKTGGYQQARLPRATKQGVDDNNNSYVTANAWKFPSKYYYAWGANFYLTVTYKF